MQVAIGQVRRVGEMLARVAETPPAMRLRALAERFGAPAISLTVLVAALFALRSLDVARVIDLVPSNPLFWLVFVAVYATPLVADWSIYRRLWHMPLAGFAPLARKSVSNDLVIGYLGDAYLYAWARRIGLVGAGAIRQMKDVAICSAAASNTTTVLIALAAAPFVGMVGLHVPLWMALGGAGLILAPAITALTLRGAIFHSSPRDLIAIVAAHAARTFVGAGLLALLWHLALPGVGLHWWLLFAAIKLVISRVPLMSNKDIVLAGVSALLLGGRGDVAEMLAMIATLMTAMHIMVGLVLAARDGVEAARGAAVGVPAYAKLTT